MKRNLCYNSTLHNVSKKKLEQGGFGLKRTALRKVSKKSDVLWNKARRICLATYGHQCFLCGATDCQICVHHWEETRTQNPARKYDQANLVPLCKKCHNHQGNDKKFYKLKSLIFNKMQRLKEEMDF